MDAMYKPVERTQPLFTIYSPEIAATEQRNIYWRVENRDLLGRSALPGVASGSDSLVEGRCRTSEAMADFRSRHRAARSQGGVPNEIEIGIRRSAE